MAFISRLIGKNKNVVCPRCLSEITVKGDTQNRCKDCDFELPIRYVQNFEFYLPLFVQVFGWTSHGKTVFLNTLRLMLLDMHKLWPGYTHQGVTELDMLHERTLRAELRKGAMPAPTVTRDRRPDEVYIMQLDKILRWRSCWLIVMDHSGESFSRMDVNVRTMPFLLKTPTTFMLISIPKIKDDTQGAAGEAMDQLLNIYIETMLRNKVNFHKQRRELVIVLTMADKIPDLPPNLRQYLISDDTWARLRSKTSPPYTADDMDAYVRKMQEVDRDIKDWLMNDTDGAPGGANMVSLIEKEGIRAHYSLVSATGYDIEQHHGESIPITPRRVLDPFYWALEFQNFGIK